MRKYTFLLSYAYSLLLIALICGAAKDVNTKPRVQTAKVEITRQGYKPGSLKLRVGVPARVTFVRTTDATCAKEIVLRDFNIRRALPLNQPVVIRFTPTEKGEFTFACGMNMMRGQLIVE
jgi:plastocyanin domain-containing protein